MAKYISVEKYSITHFNIDCTGETQLDLPIFNLYVYNEQATRSFTPLRKQKEVFFLFFRTMGLSPLTTNQ